MLTKILLCKYITLFTLDNSSLLNLKNQDLKFEIIFLSRVFFQGQSGKKNKNNFHFGLKRELDLNYVKLSCKWHLNASIINSP